eukprot:4625521-Pleurochrysis_carterae.AAC.1
MSSSCKNGYAIGSHLPVTSNTHPGIAVTDFRIANAQGIMLEGLLSYTGWLYIAKQPSRCLPSPESSRTSFAKCNL